MTILPPSMAVVGFDVSDAPLWLSYTTCPVALSRILMRNLSNPSPPFTCLICRSPCDGCYAYRIRCAQRLAVAANDNRDYTAVAVVCSSGSAGIHIGRTLARATAYVNIIRASDSGRRVVNDRYSLRCRTVIACRIRSSERKNWMVNDVLALLLSVPRIVVLPPVVVAEVSTGKFWKLFAPCRRHTNH